MTAARSKWYQPMSERAIPHVRAFLGQRLRILRKRVGLTQRELGRQARLSSRFIGDIEAGRKSISIDGLYRISVALGVPLYLLTDVGRSRKSVPSPDADRVLALVINRPHPSLQKAYEMLQMMLEDRSAGRPTRRSTGARSRPPVRSLY